MITSKNFKLKEPAKKNCIYLHVDFAGGDADTDHPENFLIKDVTMNNLDENIDTVNQLVDNFKKLKKVLGDYDMQYEDVVSEYGDEVARLYDDAPNDPQSDYQFKCYISSMELHAYDEKGDLYTQYIR